MGARAFPFGPGRRRGRSVLWAAALPVVFLSACASPVEAVAPPGVSVSLVQGRTDIATGRVAIRVRNDGDEVVRVTSATYHDPHFAAGLEWTGESDIPAGSARDLRVEVPAPACDADRESPDGNAQLRFATSNGEATAEYDVADPFDFVATHTEGACFAELLGESATIELAGVTTQPTGEGEVAVLSLRVTATAEESIRLESIFGTVLLAPESADPRWRLDATVPPGRSDVVELRAVPNRCDPHAIAEDKVGTRFRATVTILADPPVTGDLTIAATAPQRGDLYDYLARRCELSP